MLSNDDLHENPKFIRAAILRRYKVIVHITPHDNFDSILANGLMPYPDSGAPSIVAKKRGNYPARVCLHPWGAKLTPSGTSEGDHVTLCFAAEDLPQEIDLDWSHDMRKPADGIEPTIESIIDHADDVIHAAGAFISYEKIDPSKLRVFCKTSAPTLPLGWPMLNAARHDQIHTFHVGFPDLTGLSATSISRST